MKLAVAAVLAGGCLMSPPMHFGAGKSPTEAQHDTLDRLMPALLAVDGGWTGEVRSKKVRVWADDQYRAQNVHWEHAFEESLDYANAVLSSTFGVKLVPEYHEWDRHAPGAALGEDLAALTQTDPGGNGAFAVIGLTSSLGLVSATFEQIGLANLPGDHLVVRGYADVEEHQAIERALHDLRPDERQSLSDARRLHKSAALLLHELGHNFGAPHEDVEDTIMNPTYSHRSAAFSDRTRALILATLDARLARTPAAKPQPPPEAHHVALVIVITSTGATTVDGRAFDDATLDGALRYNFTRDHEAEIVIKTQRGAPHDAVIKLLDRAKATGLHRITISDDGS